MNKPLEDRIKDLERQLALKKAYLDVNFTFPKNSKLPDDVKEQVVNELKDACARLAEGMEDALPVMNGNSADFLSSEEIQVLKQLVQAAKGKLGKAAPVTQQQAPKQPEVKSQDLPEIKKAVLLTLDSVQPTIRNKMGSGETVYVKSYKDDQAFVMNRHGQGFYVPIEDLDFNLEQ